MPFAAFLEAEGWLLRSFAEVPLPARKHREPGSPHLSEADLLRPLPAEVEHARDAWRGGAR